LREQKQQFNIQKEVLWKEYLFFLDEAEKSTPEEIQEYQSHLKRIKTLLMIPYWLMQQWLATMNNSVYFGIVLRAILIFLESRIPNEIANEIA
jgi:hypothetical protein